MQVRPTGMLLMMLAGRINRRQQDAIKKTRVSLVQRPHVQEPISVRGPDVPSKQPSDRIWYTDRRRMT
jgi:hypothetical protein